VSTVLVTGATGFVGRSVLPLLVDAGYSVEAIHHSGAAPDPADVRWHRCDLFDPAETGELVATLAPELLLHLAWETTPGEFWGSERNLDWVEASIRLMRLFAAFGGERAVLIGSAAEGPGTLYGASKRALFELVRAHSEKHGYRAAWARLYHPFGPWEPAERLIPTLINGLIARRPVALSSGHQRRDFVAVTDVAHALVRLLSSDLEGAVDIGTGEATSVREVAGVVADVVGGVELLRLGARVDDPGPSLAVAETARARAELDWEPRLSLREGILQSVEWWRARHPEIREQNARI
jgi:UDP-glucose 4-epimerase